MVLSGDEIRIALANGQLVIDPLPASDAIKTSAVDLTLGDDFRRWRLPGQDVPGFVNRVDPSLEQFSFQRLAVLLETAPAETDGSVLLEPGAFLLGVTRENVELPIQSRLAARVEGRSSIARMGVGVHMTAPTIHAGFRGVITLEFTNHGPFVVMLRPGLVICQLVVEQLFGTPSHELTSGFVGQQSATGEGQPW